MVGVEAVAEVEVEVVAEVEGNRRVLRIRFSSASIAARRAPCELGGSVLHIHLPNTSYMYTAVPCAMLSK